MTEQARSRAQSIIDRVRELEESRMQERDDGEDDGEDGGGDEDVSVVMRRYRAAWTVCTPEQQEYYRTYWQQVFPDDPKMHPPDQPAPAAPPAAPVEQAEPEPKEQAPEPKGEVPEQQHKEEAAEAPAAAPHSPPREAGEPQSPQREDSAPARKDPQSPEQKHSPPAPEPRSPPKEASLEQTSASSAPVSHSPRDQLDGSRSGADPPAAAAAPPATAAGPPPARPAAVPMLRLPAKSSVTTGRRTPRDFAASTSHRTPREAEPRVAPLPPSFFLGLGSTGAPDPHEFAKAWREVGPAPAPAPAAAAAAPAAAAPAAPPAVHHVDPAPAGNVVDAGPPPPVSRPAFVHDDDDDSALAPGLLQYIDDVLTPGLSGTAAVSPSRSHRPGRCGTGPRRIGGAAPRDLAEAAGAAGAINFCGGAAQGAETPPHRVLQAYLTRSAEMRSYLFPPPQRPETVALHRRKVVLVGAGEAGKTSLTKCFERTPLFFKSLPVVGTTCGIDAQHQRVSFSYGVPIREGDVVVRSDGAEVREQDESGDPRGWVLKSGERATVVGMSHKGNLELRNSQGRVSGLYLLVDDYIRAQSVHGEMVDMTLMDFAGQEVYHSHSLFLSGRALYAFVWDMSRADAQGLDSVLTAEEERRLKGWADLVQAKCPGAGIILLGTHKDLLRDPSVAGVERHLGAVTRLLDEYLETLSGGAERRAGEHCSVIEAHAVSCKDYTAAPVHPRVKDLFRAIGGLCLRQAQNDPFFKDGYVPRSVVSLIAALEGMKQDLDTVVIPLRSFRKLAQKVGVPLEQLDGVTRALHDWDVLYLFDRQGDEGLGRSDCVFLHPRWLAQLVATVFTYVHACVAPAHERACMTIPQCIDVEACDRADPTKCILDGVLAAGDRGLAGPLFTGSLRELQREPTRENVDLCLTMLANLDIVYQASIDDEPERAYYIPSIFPMATPSDLGRHIPRLFKHRGTHMGFLLTPFPREILHMLHCRVHVMVGRLHTRGAVEAKQVTIERGYGQDQRLGLCFGGDGLVLTGVLAGTVAAASGLNGYVGWRVTHVAGTEVATVDDVVSASSGWSQIAVRIVPPPSAPSERNNWRDGWWIRGGKGDGHGPLRALIVADPTANSAQGGAGGRIDMYAVGPEDSDCELSAGGLCERFAEALCELLYKFPGVTLTGSRTRTRREEDVEACGDWLPADTFDAVRHTLPGAGDAERLLSHLGWETSRAQAERLPRGKSGMSLPQLLDHFVSGRMAAQEAFCGL
eukprot:TRINITY_DN2114_c0_g2_i1.p1 TRINITY_DN2114_c0_g2~~TRINITY_DN2114_c0_g2_i1.p1  ORF type:complete len:1250 (+),score=353.15 TRINITY_DN2114_c0_g2_i1:65-3814(+)